MTTPDSLSAVERAAEWLTRYLASQDRPVPAGTVLAAGKTIGYPERTLRRACAVAGVRVTRLATFPGGTTWALDTPTEDHAGQAAAKPDDDEPDDAAEQDEQAKDVEPDAPPPTIRVPIVANTFGYANNYVEAADAQAASHWDYRVWHSPH